METTSPYDIWGSPEFRRWPRSVRYSIVLGGAGLLWGLAGAALATLAAMLHLSGLIHL